MSLFITLEIFAPFCHVYSAMDSLGACSFTFDDHSPFRVLSYFHLEEGRPHASQYTACNPFS